MSVITVDPTHLAAAFEAWNLAAETGRCPDIGFEYMGTQIVNPFADEQYGDWLQYPVTETIMDRIVAYWSDRGVDRSTVETAARDFLQHFARELV